MGCGKAGGNVCFDADGVLWRQDAGDSYFRSCLERHILLPEQERVARRAFAAYTQGSLAEDRIAGVCAEVMQGLSDAFVTADARQFMQAHFRSHLIPEIAAWIARLQAAGVDCWVVSGSNRWFVAAGAEMVGIPATRVLAVSNAVIDGVLTSRIEQPVTFGEGKAEAIRKRLPALPDMAFGNTAQDIPMLNLATRLAVAVEPDRELLAIASSRGWAVLRP